MASANTEFDEFVKRQQASSASNNDSAQPTDWEKERAEWLAHLDELYSRISTYLQSYLDNKSITIELRDIVITEENIGRYNVKKMIIHIGSQKITLTPIGTLLIGSKGRVDVEGVAGKSRLVLINKLATGYRDMIHVTITPADKKKQKPPQATDSGARNRVEWAWKIVQSPPLTNFIELTPESFLQMILEVSNG